jgi:hypothetical protein
MSGSANPPIASPPICSQLRRDIRVSKRECDPEVVIMAIVSKAWAGVGDCELQTTRSMEASQSYDGKNWERHRVR